MLSSVGRGFGFLAVTVIFALFFVCELQAQRQPGVAASVTSHGFGGHVGMAPGVPASVTSHGSFATNHPFVHQPFGCCVNPLFPRHPVPSRGFHHRQRGFFPGTAVYAVPYYPYAYDDMDDYDQAPPQSADQYNEPAGQYNGGPTIFDRRGPGPEYNPPEAPASEEAVPAQQSEEAPAASSEPEPTAPSTVLVFRDGHQLEIANYAIVGDTLFDLTPGHSRKVALSELDLTATKKQNDDRGSDFRLPGPQGS